MIGSGPRKRVGGESSHEKEREVGDDTRAVSRRLGSESLGTSVGFILRVVGSQ